MFYSRYLTKTLQEVIEEATGQSPSEQLSLYEDLALIRETAGQAIKLYGAAQESGKAEVMLTAASFMREALNEVRVFAESIARIESSTKDKFSVHNLTHVVNQIVRIAYRVFEDDLAKAKLFEEMVRDELRFADEGGTSRTPDQDVVEMDDTIPKE